MFDCCATRHIAYNNLHIHISSFPSVSSYLFCYKFHETLMRLQPEGNGLVLTWTVSSYLLPGLTVTPGRNENIKRRPQVCPCKTLQHILVVYEKSADFNERIVWCKLWPQIELVVSLKAKSYYNMATNLIIQQPVQFSNFTGHKVHSSIFHQCHNCSALIFTDGIVDPLHGSIQ